MATAGALEAQFLRDIPELTKGSVHLIAQTLRKAGFMPRGPAGPGAPHLTSKHAAAFLLALASGVSVSSVVQATHALMDLVRARQSHTQFEENDRATLEGLMLADARTAGAAIAGMIDDMRSGAFQRSGIQYLSLSFSDACDHVSITTHHSSRELASILQFMRGGKVKRKERLVERSTYIDQRLLMNLAKALGPLEPKK